MKKLPNLNQKYRTLRDLFSPGLSKLPSTCPGEQFRVFKKITKFTGSFQIGKFRWKNPTTEGMVFLSNVTTENTKNVALFVD